MIYRPILSLLSPLVILAGMPLAASAQFRAAPSRRVHQPLNQNVPPGFAGRWAMMLGRSTPGYLQPIEVKFRDTEGRAMKGRVTWHYSAGRKTETAAAPAFARVSLGAVYRFRIHDIEKHPGVSLYPSIELIDRLHPPAGKADKYPVPIEFTSAEIDQAAAGRMVTKVVYLEQPQLAMPHGKPLPTATIPANRNLIVEADRRGRPMAIIRLGSRRPQATTDPVHFFGHGGPIQFRK